MGTYFAYYLTGFIMIPVFLFALFCQFKVKSAFNKYSKIANRRGMTGADAAYQLLRLNGITDVRIKKIGGSLTDYYDPRAKEICLSQDVFDSRSVAAIGVACHEAGHACQHAQGYAPLKIRNAVIPVTRIGSFLGIPLALIGMFLYSDPLIYAGLILYSAVAFFQLVTLPVEFNASTRAKESLRKLGIIGGGESEGVESVLDAAAFTYVAAFVSSLGWLLYMLARANSSRE